MASEAEGVADARVPVVRGTSARPKRGSQGKGGGAFSPNSLLNGVLLW